MLPNEKKIPSKLQASRESQCLQWYLLLKEIFSKFSMFPFVQQRTLHRQWTVSSNGKNFLQKVISEKTKTCCKGSEMSSELESQTLRINLDRASEC
uniref:Uncharacterized protein n=1 Tax=Ascaris lumbricoides TaxID=6252 RepID=A0A9J2PHR6_ASCLU